MSTNTSGSEHAIASTGRSVTWNKQQPFGAAMSSAAILKAISTIGTMSFVKSKTGRRSSKAAQKWNPKLVFEYGPTSFRGLMLHRKIRIAPFAEHFQKKYPTLRVFYHPVTEYNRVTVKLLNSIVCRCNISNLAYTRFASITSQNFYKQIDKTIQRVFAQINEKAFRDPVCLMTHNLDIDYEFPWYRTQFPITLNSQEAGKTRISRHQVSFDAQNFTTMHFQVQWDNSNTSVKLWDRFRRKVERSASYESMLENEAPMLGIEKRISKRKSALKTS